MEVWIRVNGRGNAWPVLLGGHLARHQALQDHALEYANTSYSILGSDGPPIGANVHWEVLIDLGQGIIPFLVQHGNRLPDAVILTHPHFDHVSGLDWYYPSHADHHERFELPDRPLVYATQPCLDQTFGPRVFPWLHDPVNTPTVGAGGRPQGQQVLPLGQAVTALPTLDPQLVVTAFPVFHGDFAPGAALLLIEYGDQKAIFSGDLLCPLLTPSEFATLEAADFAFVDANTCYPWPTSGHWSIVPQAPDGQGTDLAPRLTSWQDAHADPSALLVPQAGDLQASAALAVRGAALQPAQLPWSVLDFAALVHVRSLQLVHYSGREDTRQGGHLLQDHELASWTRAAALRRGLITDINTPRPSDLFRWVA